MKSTRCRLLGLLAALALTVGGIAWDIATGGAPQEEASGARATSRLLESRRAWGGPAAVEHARTTDIEPVDRRNWRSMTPTDVIDLFAAETNKRSAGATGITAPTDAAGLAGTGDDSAVSSLQVIGKARRGQEWEVYLLDGDVTVVARVGDRLPGDRVVEWIRPPRMSVRRVGAARAFELDIGELL